MNQNRTQSRQVPANPPRVFTSAFARLLHCNRIKQAYAPSTISFRNSERHHAEARRGGQPAPFMPLRAFADYVGLPLTLLQSYITQGLLSVLGDSDSRYVEVKVAKRELRAIGRPGKFKKAA